MKDVQLDADEQHSHEKDQTEPEVKLNIKEEKEKEIVLKNPFAKDEIHQKTTTEIGPE